MSGTESARGSDGTLPANGGETPWAAQPEEVAPASFAQRRLWIQDRLADGAKGYNVALTLALSTCPDMTALSAALTFVVRRHAPLRTCLRERAGEPWQYVLPPTPVPVARDVVAWEALAGFVAEQRARPFDLSTGPLLRATLIEPPDHAPVLLLVIHHIAFDGWSVPVLLNELAAAYRHGGAARLPPLASSYASYARRQHDAAPDAADLAWWQAGLQGLEPLQLPYDRQPGRHAPSRAVSLPVRLTPTVCDRLEAVARAGNTTLFVVLLSAFQAYLHRLTGAARIGIGVPVAGRDEAALEALVGLFVNLLVIDTAFDQATSFTVLVERVRQTMLAAMEHRSVSFEQLVQLLPDARTTGRTPLFNVAFAVQLAPEAPDFGTGLQAGIPQIDAGVRFDLELYLWRGGGGMAGVLMADADCFTRPGLMAMRQGWLVCLSRLLAAPERPVQEHDLLTPDTRRRVLEAGCPVSVGLPVARIEALFAAQAARTPDAPAVIDQAGALSYAGLDRLAARMAGGLAARGVRPGCVVALLADRSHQAIAALLAILRCGATYLPLERQQPSGRLVAMLAEAAPVLLIADEAVAGLACVSCARLAAGDDPAPDWTLPADALAYITYTSGSTGRPKGIAIPHRAVVRLALHQAYLRLGPGRRVGHAASPAFDAVTFEIWSTLLAGAAVAVLPRATVLDPALLAAAIRANRIDTLFVTTALFNQLVDTAPDALAQLQTLLFGGEACDPERVRRALRNPPRRLLHVYGPTESTTFATWFEITAVAADATAVPIGRPLDNTTAHVLDPLGELVAPGSTGELHIGGEGLACGYVGNPAQTASRFIPDGITGRPGARLYRTGDRVRLADDGTICFLGRLDRQVKIRGFRIEPGEIEAALQRLAGVTGAAVMTDLDGEGRPVLRAYVAGPAQPAAAELREALRASLPEWMIPASITVLPRLPLTSNGKLDRDALAEPEAVALPAAADRGDDLLQAEISLLVAESLARRTVGAEDDIFGLGGHSLSMIRLAARLRERFRIELPLAPLFAAPTVAGITRAVRTALRGEELLPIEAVPNRRHAPLSFAQARLWFLHRMGLTGAAYHSPFSVQMRGPLNETALRRALNGLAERHATLRTLFEEHDGQPRQRILGAAEVPLRVVDMPGDVAGLIAEFSTTPFDLRVEVPLRALLLRLGPRHHVLTLVFHHIAFDGWSLPIVARDLSAWYGACVAGATPALPRLPVQYADYAAWQTEWLTGPRLQRLLEWWCGRLADIAELDLPTDFARPDVQRHDGGTCRIAWPGTLQAGLLDFAGTARATPYMVLLAAFIALLHRLTGQDCIVLGAPIANRNREELHELVGFFVNSLVLAADCSGDPDFHELVRRVRQTTLDAYAFHELPFERLVEALRPQREFSRHPLFQTVFVLQQSEALSPHFDLAGLQCEILPIAGDMPVRFDLELHLTLTPDGIAGYVFYDRALFEQASIERMLGQYRRLMTNLIATPEQPISTVPLDSADALQALEAWSHA